MRCIKSLVLVVMLPFLLSSCTHHAANSRMDAPSNQSRDVVPQKTVDYASRVPQHIKPRGEKVVVVYPKVNAWGAYDASGELVRAGIATTGAHYCPDIKRACRTKAGSFRIASLGSKACKSSMYPLPRGGAPMPYCMFFNGHQGLHGSYNVVDGKASHGCVRMTVSDAEWMRFNFARVGTKVIVESY